MESQRQYLSKIIPIAFSAAMPDCPFLRYPTGGFVEQN